VYQWSSATLSLGYFQRYQDRRRHAPSEHCPVVRRVTGGGAIVHDREVTYSLTASLPDQAHQPPPQWYELIHSAWVNVLAKHGIAGSLCPAGEAGREGRFLCFQRRAAGDVLLAGCKIAGSAQRRRRQALLQHGSLLLERSPAAPELPGIAQLAAIDLGATAWLEEWIGEVGRRLGVAWETGGLSDRELELAATFARERFDNAKWTLRR
jgi:lipoate-protein ligase A